MAGNKTERRGRGYRSRLTRAEQDALGAIARRHGYADVLADGIVLRAPVVFILAIISGEVTTVLLNGDERRHVVAWLAAQADTLEDSDYLLSETIRDLARQLAPGEEEHDGSV